MKPSEYGYSRGLEDPSSVVVVLVFLVVRWRLVVRWLLVVRWCAWLSHQSATMGSAYYRRETT